MYYILAQYVEHVLELALPTRKPFKSGREDTYDHAISLHENAKIAKRGDMRK